MNLETDVAKRTSLNELCDQWQKAQEEVQQGFALLVSAQKRLCDFFATDQSHYGRFQIDEHNHRPDYAKPEEAIDRLQREIWGVLTDRLELRKILSKARLNELDEQIKTGEGLPPLTYSNILAIVETNMNNAPQYLQEKVFEVYEWLRPGGWQRSKYKTNEKSYQAGVGRKVIRAYGCSRRYDGGFEVGYNRTEELRALDQVMHLLDGAPMAGASYNGPLVDAIREQTSREKSTFETPYFRGRCFANNNLHLEFVRLDLLQKFNEVAGGYRLNEKAA